MGMSPLEDRAVIVSSIARITRDGAFEGSLPLDSRRLAMFLESLK
jgi:hypothetical protein